MLFTRLAVFLVASGLFIFNFQPVQARRGVHSGFRPVRALEYSDALSFFGVALKYMKCRPAFPGSSRTWMSFLGADSVDSALDELIERDGGTPLLLYSALVTAPPAVQDYVTSSAQRIESYYKVLRPYDSLIFPDSAAVAAEQDLSRILRRSIADSAGLRLDLDDRVSRVLLRKIARAPDSESGPVVLTPGIIKKLLPRPGISGYSQASKADTIEFLQYLQDTHPGLLTDQLLSALMSNLDQAPLFLDLIGEIVPEPALLSKYLDYCGRLARAGTDDWNVNRTRTSQSIFFLISALFHEGAISEETADGLLEKALDSFSPDSEAAFAGAVADFLSGELLPAISTGTGDSRDPVLSALAGRTIGGEFTFGGRRMKFDIAGSKLHRIRSVLETQSYTPLPVLLRSFHLLAEIRSAGRGLETDKYLLDLSEQLNRFHTAERTPGETKKIRERLARVDIDSLKRKIETLGSWAGDKDISGRVRKITEQLHVELGVTLLAYCYAYAGDPRIDVISFDPNLARKHRFYGSRFRSERAWSRCHFEQDKMDSWMEGSLAGLEFEMGRLLIPRLARSNLTESEAALASTVLFGIRRVRPDLRSERGQEYVAVATRLGRNLLSLATKDAKIRRWILESLSGLISRQRLERLSDGLSKEGSMAGINILFPSELFLLGREYRESPLQSEDDSGFNRSPEMARLGEIVPEPGSRDYNDFRREIDQYGALLTGRTGLSWLTFDKIEPYERLATGLRAQLLYDRICDLKIRVAELNHATGIPAAISEQEAELALRSIMSRSPGIRSSGNWRRIIERMSLLNQQDALRWVVEISASDSGPEKGGRR